MADHDIMIEEIGNDPLADGMALSVRLRRDFTVTDADRLLTTARRIYREIKDTNFDEADGMVTCAADALFIVLEHAGVLGDATDSRLAAHAGDGLDVGGWRARVVINEPHPLAPGPRSNCLRGDEVFMIPPSGTED